MLWIQSFWSPKQEDTFGIQLLFYVCTWKHALLCSTSEDVPTLSMQSFREACKESKQQWE